MAVGLAGDRIRETRDTPGVPRSRSPGESGDREVEAPPEEVHRARLAEEGRPELLEHAVDLHQRLEEPAHRAGVVRALGVVLGKRDRAGDLVRVRIESRACLRGSGRARACAVEVSDRSRTEREAGRAAIRRASHHRVVEQVQVEVDRSRAVGHRDGGQAGRRDVERGVPGVVLPRRVGQPVLARGPARRGEAPRRCRATRLKGISGQVLDMGRSITPAGPRLPASGSGSARPAAARRIRRRASSGASGPPGCRPPMRCPAG